MDHVPIEREPDASAPASTEDVVKAAERALPNGEALAERLSALGIAWDNAEEHPERIFAALKAAQASAAEVTGDLARFETHLTALFPSAAAPSAEVT